MATFKSLNGIGGYKIMHKDKYVHFTFYFVFTLFWYWYGRSKSSRLKNVRLTVFLSAVVYGILIEICQGVFTTARNADILDVLANTLGSAVAIFILWLFRKK